jgi:hypothetical protein
MGAAVANFYQPVLHLMDSCHKTVWMALCSCHRRCKTAAAGYQCIFCCLPCLISATSLITGAPRVCPPPCVCCCQEFKLTVHAAATAASAADCQTFRLRSTWSLPSSTHLLPPRRPPRPASWLPLTPSPSSAGTPLRTASRTRPHPSRWVGLGDRAGVSPRLLHVWCVGGSCARGSCARGIHVGC